MTPIGNFESGGGQPVDFWKVKLLGGDKVQLALSMPANLCCSSSYDFNLYPPGTTDTKFPQVAPVANVSVDNSTKATIVLQAPRSGTFTLAVCENIRGDCRGDRFRTVAATRCRLIPSRPSSSAASETRTTLFLSASSIKHGSEKKLKVSVKVAAQFSGKSAGTVTISAGKKTVCRAKLVKGKGSCSPSSNTLLGPGTYSVVASFPGSKGSAASKSGAKTLVVKK